MKITGEIYVRVLSNLCNAMKKSGLGGKFLTLVLGERKEGRSSRL